MLVIGALPGLGPSIGLSLLIPFAHNLGPKLSMLLMISLYTSAEYGGSISAILLSTPGTAADPISLLFLLLSLVSLATRFWRPVQARRQAPQSAAGANLTTGILCGSRVPQISAQVAMEATYSSGSVVFSGTFRSRRHRR